MLHSTIINLRSKILVALFASLTLGLSGCGGGGSDGDTGTTTTLSTSDFEKQVYIKKEETGEDSATALLFMTGGAGKNYDNDGEGNFSWAIANDKLDIGVNNDNINFELKSKTDNKYTFTITEPSGTFESDFFRAKPLSISELNGKILSIALSDDSCTAKTIKFSASTIVYKEKCSGSRGNGGFTGIVSESSDVENMLELSWTDEEDNEPRDLKLVIIEGDIAQTATVGLINIHNNIFNKVNVTTFTATAQEAY